MQFITVQMNDAIRHLSTVAKVNNWASSIDVEFTHERGTKVCFKKDMFNNNAISLDYIQIDYRRTEVRHASELRLTEEGVLLVAAAMYAIKAETITAGKAFIKLEAPQPVQTTVFVERQVIVERQVVVERPVIRRTERTITTRDHNTASGAALVGLGLAILMGGR